MKRIIAIIVVLILSVGSFAQDMIVKKDGSIIQAKVSEIGTLEVKYKKWSNQDGPSYSISKCDILAITYQNGEKEIFEATKQNNQQQVEPSSTNVNVAFNNADLLNRYRKQVVFKKSQKPGKYVPSAIAVFGFSDNSVLSTDDVEIHFVRSKSTNSFGAHLIFRYSIAILNKTDKTIYIDLSNCTRANKKTMEAYSFYNGESVAVSVGSSSSVGLSGVIGRIGIGGGSSSSSATTQSLSQKSMISIPAHGMSVIRDFKLTKSDRGNAALSRGEEFYFGQPYGSNFIDLGWGGIERSSHTVPAKSVRNNEIVTYSYEESPLVLEYNFTYSKDADLKASTTINANLFLRELIGLSYPRTNPVGWFWDKKAPLSSICADMLDGYDDYTIFGSVTFGK